MKKEEKLVDSLLNEHYRNREQHDEMFVASVLQQIEQKQAVAPQRQNPFLRIARPVAAVAVVGVASWAAYEYLAEGGRFNPENTNQDVVAYNDSYGSEQESVTYSKDAISRDDSPPKTTTNSITKSKNSTVTPSTNAIQQPAPLEVQDKKSAEHLSDAIRGKIKPSAPGEVRPVAGAYRVETKSTGRNSELAKRDSNASTTFGLSIAPSPKQTVAPRKMQLPKPASVAQTRNQHQNLAENKATLTSKNNTSTFSIDVDTASYTQLRKSIMKGHGMQPAAIRIEEMINYFEYDYPQPKSEHPFSVNVETSVCPWNAQNKLVKIGIQGKDVAQEDRPPVNLVFLIDTSGSMQAPDKLPLLRQSLKTLTESMSERDSISIVTYAGSTGVALTPTKLTDAGRRKVLAVLSDLSAHGSTAGAAGLQLAYQQAHKAFVEEGVNRVMLATDGDFNVGISGTEALTKLVKQKAADGVEISVLGFGSGNLNDHMLEAISNNGNGNYHYIDTAQEGVRVLAKNTGSTLHTIAKDVKIQTIFNDDSVMSYRLIGYANRLLAKEDFNNDQVDAGEIGSGHSVTALYEVTLIGDKQDNDLEMLKVNLRYKQPKGSISTLIEHSVPTQYSTVENASKDMKFASSVALFGMLKRNSTHAGDGTIGLVQELGKAGVGETDAQARKEFIALTKK